MQPPSHRDNRLRAVLFVLTAVGVASTQDAITKAMSGSYSAYETVIFRCLGSYPMLLALIAHQLGFAALGTPLLPRILLRSVILCTAYFGFVLAIAAMPIANAVAIYFTMPFFVAGLAFPLLGERVRLHRWVAIAAAFAGVLVMVRPGAGVFEPASFFALYSAVGYAYGQMIGRALAQQVSPLVIATWQNTIYLAAGLAMALIFNSFDFSFLSHKSLVFLSRPWVWPSAADAAILTLNGVLAGLGMLFFVSAYKYGESNFVAPFEYSGMIWALLYGFLIFGDVPDGATWTGAAVVIAAGLFMLWRDRVLDRTA
jgi:drug/metabolite transporter (DMT)-like permease